MKIGCFALVQPFLPVAEQLKLIKEMGVDYADVTDNHDGGSLGVRGASPLSDEGGRVESDIRRDCLGEKTQGRR